MKTPTNPTETSQFVTFKESATAEAVPMVNHTGDHLLERTAGEVRQFQPVIPAEAGHIAVKGARSVEIPLPVTTEHMGSEPIQHDLPTPTFKI